ncbi:MAG TPA: penicillin-binding protein 1A [Bdellovibrionales bacterium]|nr:penicillin-binding protein 1A [Bdellovibrionales bacterium]|tara:strand:+ start:99363 stop:102026 length:2664 start_codon:yes stop_codon:yes gene_type:complete
MKKILIALSLLVFVGVAAVAGLLAIFSSSLPQMIQIEDYKPLVVSEVFDRHGEKIGEFFREKRMLTPYEKIPPHLVQAFISAEDDQFFQHEGINYLAIFRAFVANLKAGRKAQGGSTITQQVARTLLLSSEKTYTRKIKEVMLAKKMEKNLSKEEILYLYLNQIYLGQGAYGVGAAARVYFRKNVEELTVPEAAILAGLPQAPSRYSPIHNPKSAKERQRYVLTRMADVGFISPEDAEKYKNEPVKLYIWKNFKEIAPYYLETVRQMLVEKVGEEMVLDRGIKVYTGLDLKLQKAAQEQIEAGLRAHDKRQGFRGVEKNLEDPKQVAELLLEERNRLMDDLSPERILKPDGSFEEKPPLNLTGKDKDGKELPSLASYIPVGTLTKGIVTKVDDKLGMTYVRFAENRGIIDIESMEWTRTPDPDISFRWAPKVTTPSKVLKVGDVIEVRITGKTFKSERLEKDAKKLKYDPKEYENFALLELEQEPLAQSSLISFDQKSGDVVAMVGGADFSKSQFNRALQAVRQTGSAFKALTYATALDHGYTPATPIIDAPIVYEEEIEEGQEDTQGGPTAPETKTWKPKNSGNKFSGDILFRRALIKSLNVPTVKITEKVGVNTIATYARRLGIFSPLNMDFTLSLGSSSVTLYEITRAFAVLGRMGKRLSPILIRKVMNQEGEELSGPINLDERFKEQLEPIEQKFEETRQAVLASEEVRAKEPPLFFENPNQLMKPETAYVTTSMLQAVIEEQGGTAPAARALGRPAAGKTGSTNGYFDAWFIGYTPDYATGVWTGFDEEKTLGKSEFGGTASLPVWLEYMKAAHDGLPVRNFPVPENVVFVNIDNETGKLVGPQSKMVVRQAFIEGTEPTAEKSQEEKKDDDQNFFKEDLSG